MVVVEIDVITVTAHQCVHCKELFLDIDAALEHLDKCPAHAQHDRLRAKSYIEDSAFGNMILKEGAT